MQSWWRALRPFSPAAKQFDVIFVLPHLGRGGAQRVTSLVANAWSRQGKRICIATWDGKTEVAHDIDPRVERIDIPAFLHEELRQQIDWRRVRYDIRLYLREAERWGRSRWRGRNQGRKARQDVPVAFSFHSEPKRRRRKWSARRIRNSISRAALSVALKTENESVQTLASSLARNLFAHFVLGRHLNMFRMLFSRVKAPVVVSLLTKTNLLVIEGARGEKIRVVVSERNDPELQVIDNDLALLRMLAYPEADAVTSNSAGVLSKLSAFVPAEKLRLLPNPIIAPVIQDTEERGNRFVTVARLVHQKGVDLLLNAFAQIAGELDGWTLEVVGDGPLSVELRAQAEALRISDRVTFHGHVPDPIAVMQRCRVFVLPSRFEGMPNALLEAMASGLAPIVTDASPGPLESVSHEKTGLVVPTENVDALASAMRLLAGDSAMTDRIAHQARIYVKEHDWPAVEPQWLDVLEGRR
jgi:glycosyltransferase involved in cell wall biosynthesis